MSEEKEEPSPEQARIEIGKFLQSDAREITAARERALEVHHAKDIRAAGNEVEETVRQVLTKRLPAAYDVVQGHIVDHDLRTSPQLDVIIADAASTTPLAVLKDGTRYIPYESVYAVGEVKSAYDRSKKPVHAFAKTLLRLREELHRDQTPPNYLGQGIALGAGMSTSDSRPYKNPLFSFILFANSGNFDLSDISSLYESTPVHGLPNIACFLDQGTIVAANIDLKENNTPALGPLAIIPEFEPKGGEKRRLKWALLPFGSPELRLGANYGFLYFALMSHLTSAILSRPDLLRYLNGIFTFGNGQAFTDVR